MFINLHSHVLAKLAAREVPWTQVARETGIPYETLKKIASQRTPNPGVQHVQTLADYFSVLETTESAPQKPSPEVHAVSSGPLVKGDQPAAQAIAPESDGLPPISDLPPIVATPTALAWDGIDRRAPVSKPLPPELDRRALVGGV